MRTLFVCTAFLALVVVGTGPADAQVKIDGLFFDWPPSSQLDVDPNAELTFDQGDDTDPVRNVEDPGWTPPLSYFADMDIEDVYALDDGDFIYFRVKMASIANALNIASDTSYHGGGAIAVYISVDPGENDTTGLTWGWWGSGYDFFVQVYPEDTLFSNNTQYQQGLWEHVQGFDHGWNFVYADSLRGVQVAWNAGA
ncbi:MAG: Por secretion system C-terminal sorting protein, partial [Bacteroidetes bacterium]|nr:Por secretion system C-terminal sorting protein [Bacteroidota bacterium]